jgi:hypothetical protein
MKQTEQAGDENDACLAGRLPASPLVKVDLVLNLAQPL